MTTVEQFIKYLQTLPQDAEVQVIGVDTYGNADFENLNLCPKEGNVEFSDTSVEGARKFIRVGTWYRF